jgi:CcmD family protein
MTGVVEGGWEFVVAAYSITGLVLAAYTGWLIGRLKELKKHD